MANSRTFQFPALLALLFAGSASALNLSNLQLISSTSVSIDCITAYNTELLGCNFQEAPLLRCTRRCRNSLTRAQVNVQQACGNVEAAEGTVLAAAQSGLLTEAVCANASPDRGQEGNQGGDAPIVVTITTRTTIGADETLITAPTQTAVVGFDEDRSVLLPTSATVTITTAIVPRPANGVPTGSPNPPPVGESDPSRPNNGDGDGSGSGTGTGTGSGRVDRVDSAGTSAHPLRAATLLCAAAAGALLIML